MDEEREVTGLKDPITGFVYPGAWIARCTDPAGLRLVREGLGILTSSGRVLRRGFTTGTTAAAACKAAVLSLAGEVEGVDVSLPCGIRVRVTAHGRLGTGRCTKYSGDHPHDVTSGMEFVAKAAFSAGNIALVASDGIGRFARDTARHGCGEPAISPPARRCILGAIQEACREIGADAVSVELAAPRGKEVANRTLNAQMGIEGGISILGSTGLVEPWGEHLLGSVLERVEQMAHPVLTTGRTGTRIAGMLFPEREVILVGARIAEVLEKRSEDVVLCGLPGLILKFIDPKILEGTGFRTVEELMAAGHCRDKVADALRKFKERMPGVRVVLVDREGRILEDTG